MKTASMVAALVAGAAIWVITTVGASAADEQAEKAGLRVGVFDSRAVAVAYAGSNQFQRSLEKVRNEYKEAEARGDSERMAQLKAEGRAGQHRLHEQGFSTASVADILDQIKDQIPGIAQEAQVDIIVSKWDLVYQAPGVQFVDVTTRLIQPFHPKERGMRTIEELEKVPPIPLEEAKKIKAED